MFEKPIPCIVDLFGHDQIAGMVSEVSAGGGSFIRIDVPAVGEQQPFTKLFGVGAIYAIAPVDETIMIAAAENLRVRPVQRYMLPAPLRLLDETDRPDTGLYQDVENIGDEDEGF